MMITMTRYKLSELEAAVKEKLKAGWECVGAGIVSVGNEKKIWTFDEGKPSKYAGRTMHQKFMVRMRKADQLA